MSYQERNGAEHIELLGNVFRPVPGQPLTIAYSYGPAEAKSKTPMFTCPVSAIPDEVWDLLQLFHECRLMKLPPVQGGVLDQPLLVRKSFPIFEQEMAKVRMSEDAMRAQHAAMATGMTVVTALFGGKGKG